MATIKEIADLHVQRLQEARNGMDAKTFATMIETFSDYMTPGKSAVDKLPLREALSASDASIIFPRVFSNQLVKPQEPAMIGQNFLCRKVRIEGARSVEIPGIGALRAQDLADGQAYPEQSLDFREWRTEIKTGKSGVACALPEDVINDSQWELVGLHLEAAQYALNRWKEEKIFREFNTWGHTVFDNCEDDETALTNGKGADSKTRNGSVTLDDIVDALGALVANEFNPTDIILHPLAWVIFSKNPVLRNLMLTQSTLGQTVYKTYGPDSIQANVPWNINVQITPFQNYEPGATKTIFSAANTSSSVTDDFTTITVVDRSQSMLLLVKEDPSTEQFNDPMRDVLYLKLREKYGLGVLNQGRSVAVIRNVRTAEDHSPVYNIGTVAIQ
jgi:hypothetical protein